VLERRSRTRPTLSIVVPCFNEAEVLGRLRRELTQLADRLAPALETEILLVDDGSRDLTWSLIREFASADPRFRGLSLSRNFGHQAALTCGYDLAEGDAVVSLDADLQDPPEVVLEMIEHWRKGADVVLGVREQREGETRFKRWTAALFYRAAHALGARELRSDLGDFRLLSRQSLLGLRRLREQHRFVRGMVGWVGFNTAEVRYRRRPRAAGRTKYDVARMLRLAADATVSFSRVPLRIAYVSAFAIALGALGTLGYAVLAHLIRGTPLVAGHASLILVITAFGSMTLFCLGLLGEYVGRIYEQNQQRPLYLVDRDTGAGTAPGRAAPTEPAPGRGGARGC
jgi:glycosyltransferase involved in cell wall biosynthesis